MCVTLTFQSVATVCLVLKETLLVYVSTKRCLYFVRQQRFTRNQSTATHIHTHNDNLQTSKPEKQKAFWKTNKAIKTDC